MKIMIDIGHPGHVHLFKNFAKVMQAKGHEFLFTCRQKEFEIELLKAEGFLFKSFGSKFNTTLGKVFGLLKFGLMEFFSGLKFKPDVLMSHGSPYAAQASAFLKKPHISLEDTGNMEQVKLYLPFSECVLTSNAFHRELGEKQIRYAGYHELAYLHPNNFRPNKKVYQSLQIDPSEKYVLLRFVSWNASHDVNQSGLTLMEKQNIIQFLEKTHKVFISAEGDLPVEFEKYRIQIRPEEMHDVLAFADMFIGEGATMASECAVLGTPALYINSITAGTIDEQVNYGLLFNYKNGMQVLDKIKELLADTEIKITFQKRRELLLKDKIDVTAFMVWFVENYPKSKKVMLENPEFQNTFK